MNEYMLVIFNNVAVGAEWRVNDVESGKSLIIEKFVMQHKELNGSFSRMSNVTVVAKRVRFIIYNGVHVYLLQVTGFNLLNSLKYIKFGVNFDITIILFLTAL